MYQGDAMRYDIRIRFNLFYVETSLGDTVIDSVVCPSYGSAIFTLCDLSGNKD